MESKQWLKVIGRTLALMAREKAELTGLLEGAFWATGIALGIEAYRRYRVRHRDERTRATVACTKCGETLTVNDFLDPTVTCACVASNDQQM